MCLVISKLYVKIKYMLKITKTLCKNYWEGRFGYKPEIIVIHISAGSMTSMDSWFQTQGSSASAHYGVARDGMTIHQYVEEKNSSWANGRVNNPSSEIVKSRPGVNPNYYSISIENEGLDLNKGTEPQILTLFELIKDIAGRYNIPIDRKHIIGHWEIDAINRPYCPSPDHALLDRMVKIIQNNPTPTEEMVSIQVKKSKLQKVLDFLKTI